MHIGDEGTNRPQGPELDPRHRRQSDPGSRRGDRHARAFDRRSYLHFRRGGTTRAAGAGAGAVRPRLERHSGRLQAQQQRVGVDTRAPEPEGLLRREVAGEGRSGRGRRRGRDAGGADVGRFRRRAVGPAELEVPLAGGVHRRR